MTYALDLENQNINRLDLTLWYSHNPEEEIRRKCEQFNRSIRRLENVDSFLEKDEWIIAFYGFIPIHFNYEGFPDRYDYHFMKLQNGVWMHRPSIGKTICVVTEDVLSAFIAEGYQPQYFAVKRIED